MAKRVFNGGQTAEERQRRGQKQQTGDLGKTLLAAKAKSEDHKRCLKRIKSIKEIRGP